VFLGALEARGWGSTSNGEEAWRQSSAQCCEETAARSQDIGGGMDAGRDPGAEGVILAVSESSRQLANGS
jgi:hypothetical protein